MRGLTRSEEEKKDAPSLEGLEGDKDGARFIGGRTTKAKGAREYLVKRRERQAGSGGLIEKDRMRFV